MIIHRIADYGQPLPLEKSTQNLTCTTSSCKGKVWLRLTTSFIIGPYFFRRDGCFRSCYPYHHWSVLWVFFFNYVLADLQQRLCVGRTILIKMEVLCKLQIQWNSSWSSISDMLELSSVISLQLGRPDYLILIRVTYGCKSAYDLLLINRYEAKSIISKYFE